MFRILPQNISCSSVAYNRLKNHLFIGLGRLRKSDTVKNFTVEGKSEIRSTRTIGVTSMK